MIKNITKEVVRDCAKLNVYLDENLVALAVRLLCLDPANGLQLNRTYERRELEEFVIKCVDRLKGYNYVTCIILYFLHNFKYIDVNNPSLKSIHMQLFTMDHTIDIERISQLHSNAMLEKTAKLTNDLLSAHGSTLSERDKLFKKLTLDIIVNNYLGSASNQKVIYILLEYSYI